ncbi:MAG TPA: hypothetical protein VK731_05205 [Candidatus Cybelea sp.]|jgi:hypothetical protein|nr:hypothetical protein [Candidatus Cybelea sp.]
MRLLDYSSNVYSQTGEDGILEKVLETLPQTDKWCVEFGAWDGQHLSNTCNLIERRDYSAVLIEGSERRFLDLTRRHGKNGRVIAMNAFVGFTQSDGLDALLSKTPIPREFDLLSIDIDGNDYHVWGAFGAYAPKVVCIEYNPTIPTELEFIQPADPAVSQGSSLLALVKLGKQKGYELVAATSLNAIFVRSQYFGIFGISNNEPRALREDTASLTYVFAGYDGTIFHVGSNLVLWHGVTFSSRTRQLPKIFREYSGNFGPFRSLLFRWYRKLCKRLYPR